MPTLKALAASRHEVACVVTRPPRGRGGKAPMEEAAEALGLPRDTSRVLATELITGRIAKFWSEHGGKPGN